MPDPTFLVIGAQKCGTTWLEQMISQHPRVCTAATKEVHFFNLRANYEKGLLWYRRQFGDCEDAQAVGEFTPNYLWNSPPEHDVHNQGVIPHVAPLVREAYPDVRLIVSLRDPVERAISSYHHQIHMRRVRPGQSILEVAHRHGIVSLGFYRDQIAEWLEFFDRSQFLFLVYEEDIVREPAGTVARVFDFIGVDSDFLPSGIDQRRGERRSDLYRRIHFVSPALAKGVSRVVPAVRSIDWPPISVTDAERAELRRAFVGVNDGLDDLVGREISWLRHYLGESKPVA